MREIVHMDYTKAERSKIYNSSVQLFYIISLWNCAFFQQLIPDIRLQNCCLKLKVILHAAVEKLFNAYLKMQLNFIQVMLYVILGRFLHIELDSISSTMQAMRSMQAIQATSSLQIYSKSVIANL